MTTADNAADINQLPEGQAPPSAEDVSPETEAAAREREIQRRLTQQGRELATANRNAQAAAQAAMASQQQAQQLQAQLTQLTNNLNARDQREAQERQQRYEAELASLPPADRLQRQIEMLQGQVKTLTTMRTAVPQAQPAPRQPAPQPQAPPQREATDDERRQYMEQRVKQIVSEAERTYGVRPDLDQIPDAAWETEDAFIGAVMTQARSAGGNNVAPKKQDETPAQMRERIRQEERERLGATSPAAPRAAGTGGRKKAATEAEVRGAAQSYDSKLGPKANIARMKQLRESMG